MRRTTLGIGLCLGWLVMGCVGGSKGLSSEDKERLKPYVLEVAPGDMKKIEVNFEDKVHIIGYKVEPELARPGQEVRITYYWRCEDKVDDGWQLFTHVHDPVSDKLDNLDDVGPIREKKNNKQVMGPDRWEKGKIYVDEQSYRIPDWVKGPELEFMIGVWKNDARLRVKAGPQDGDNRAIVAKVKTGLTVEEPKKTQNIPTMTVNKLAANDKIVIDGKGDDKAWGGAASTGPFVDVGTGKPNASFPVNGSAKLAWDDANLYVLFEVSDPDLTSGFTSPKEQPGAWTATGQPKMWTKDTVEIMVDPDGDGDNKDYYELQIGPQNKVFHSQFDTRQQPGGGENGPYGHEDWDPKLKSAVTVRGTIDKHDDKDEGYTVEAAIPWAAFSKAAHHPPRHGDSWRMNFYAMQDNGGTSWSPILGQGNFHWAPRFGRVTWAIAGKPLPDAGASPTAAAEDAAAPAAAASGSSGSGAAPIVPADREGIKNVLPRLKLPPREKPPTPAPPQ